MITCFEILSYAYNVLPYASFTMIWFMRLSYIIMQHPPPSATK